MAATSFAGVAAAAPQHRQHLNFQAEGFAYGDPDAARAYLRRIYPVGLVAASDVVADLRRAGAACEAKAGETSCRHDDSFIRDDFVRFGTWTVQVDSRPDGALAHIDVTQTLSQ